MSDFQPAPVTILDQQQTLDLLAQGEDSLPDSINKFRIKSSWLVKLLNEKARLEGFQYNRQFQEWFEQHFSLGSLALNKNTNSILSLLIYNAQCYRRHDALVEAGWVPGTTAVLERAYKHNRKLEYLGESIIGDSTVITLTIREVKRQLYAFPPRKRKPINVIGQPVRLPTTPSPTQKSRQRPVPENQPTLLCNQ